MSNTRAYMSLLQSWPVNVVANLASALPDTVNRARVLSDILEEQSGGMGWEQEKPSTPSPSLP